MITNFKEVYLNLWRGGQPQTLQDWHDLAGLGVKTVLKLNTDEEGSDMMAGGFGITVICRPINLIDQILEGTPHDFLMETSHLINDAMATGGVFVHCQHGQDRTGLVIGAFRAQEQNWTKDAAWLEMLDNGFHELLVGLCLAWLEFTPNNSANPLTTPLVPLPSDPASSGPAPDAPASAP